MLAGLGCAGCRDTEGPAAWGEPEASSHVDPRIGSPSIRTKRVNGVLTHYTEPESTECLKTWRDQDRPCEPVIVTPNGMGFDWRTVRSSAQKHGWVVTRGPAEGDATTIEVELQGGRWIATDPDGLGAVLANIQGERWRYDGLAAWDATGRSLATRIEGARQGFRVVVETGFARWPITVDPAIRPFTWTETLLTASNATASDEFGLTAAAIADTNGDGYDDVVVGDYLGSNDGKESGVIYVYPGDSGGITTASEVVFGPPDARDGEWFGYTVAAAGDVDADGYHDVAVGALRHEEEEYSGAVFLFYGSPEGLSLNTVERVAPPAVEPGFFGFSLAGVGDVDADGFDDVLVGGASGEVGLFHVLYGSSPRGSPGRWQTIYSPNTEEWDCFGASLAGAGDVNMDGFADLVIGAYCDDAVADSSGSVHVYSGSANGVVETEGEWVAPEDLAQHDQFGRSVGAAGDVDGDGFGDVLVGAWGSDFGGYDQGAATVLFGSASGVSSRAPQRLTATDGRDLDDFGLSVAGVGDIDNDGYSDVLIGAPGDDDGGSEAGALYLYYGSNTGAEESSESKIRATDTAGLQGLGALVIGTGDLNGDHVPELIAGAYKSVVVFASCDDIDEDGICSTVDCDDTDPRERAPTEWFADVDLDGYGDPDRSVEACDPPSGHVANADDCDDSEAAAYPGAPETCDEIDNDCDGEVDGQESLDAETWYLDEDGDGFGSEDATLRSCSHPTGAVDGTAGFDCDDEDAAINPDAAEVVDDGIDQDCDGMDSVSSEEGCQGCTHTAGPSGGRWLWACLLPAMMRTRKLSAARRAAITPGL